VGIAYDVISSQETQEASLEILAPNGNLVLTRPLSVDTQKDNQYITLVYGSVRGGKNTVFGREMYAELTSFLADGSIKVNCLRASLQEVLMLMYFESLIMLN
jgi:D-arabinose 1-dehydrogenase-like Zn-dependent alcohol dehydrogenase